jgi:ribosomal protein L12E/L44/L45/RPP1/RPP2
VAEPTEEELRAQLAEQLGQIRIGDLLLQTLYTLSSLTYQRISAEDRDLVQARLGIEALRALVTVLEDSIPVDARRDFNQLIANLQLAYAAAATAEQPVAAEEPAPAEEPEPGEPEPAEEPEPGEPDAAG